MGYHNVNRKKEEQYRILRKFALTELGEQSIDDVEKVLIEDFEASFNSEEVKRFLKKGWEI